MVAELITNSLRLLASDVVSCVVFYCVIFLYYCDFVPVLRRKNEAML